MKKHLWISALASSTILVTGGHAAWSADEALHGINDVSLVVSTKESLRDNLTSLASQKLSGINLVVRPNCDVSLTLSFDGSLVHLAVSENVPLPSNKAVTRPVVIWEKTGSSRGDSDSINACASDLLDKFSLEYLKANMTRTGASSGPASTGDAVKSADNASGTAPKVVDTQPASGAGSTNATTAAAPTGKSTESSESGGTPQPVRPARITQTAAALDFPSPDLPASEGASEGASGKHASSSTATAAPKHHPVSAIVASTAGGAHVGDSPPDSYISAVNDKIHEHLPESSSKAIHDTRIDFNITATGAILNHEVNVYNSSGIKAFDDAIVHAVKASAPFLPGGAERALQAYVAVGASDPTIRDRAKDPAVDFGSYMANIQKQLKARWHPPKESQSKRVVVFFRIRMDGTIFDQKIFQSSGMKECDDAGLEAISAAGTLPPLPSGAPDFVDIRFTYDYNVHPKK